MGKYYKTFCQDEGKTKGMIHFSVIPRKAKTYKCYHCQKEHHVVKRIISEKPLEHYFDVLHDIFTTEFNE